MATESRKLLVDGITLDVVVVRKRVKNINVRMVGDELRVSAPRWVSAGELDETVETLARRLVRRERAKKVNGEDDAIPVLVVAGGILCMRLMNQSPAPRASTTTSSKKVPPNLDPFDL